MTDNEPAVSDYEAAEAYRRDRLEAAARKSGFEPLDRESFLHWLEDNSKLMAEFAAARGLSLQDAKSVMDFYAETIRSGRDISPYDDPAATLLLEHLISEVENICRSINLPLGAGVAFGTDVQMGVEASHLAVMQTTASIISVSRPFLPFCSLASKLMSLTLPQENLPDDNMQIVFDPNEIDKRLKSNPQLMAGWTLFIASYAITGFPPKPHMKFDLSGNIGANQLHILRSMELFAIAHEYGHHVLGHGRVASSDQQEGCLAQEFDADLFARSICLAVKENPSASEDNSEPNFYAYSGVGAVIILGLLEVVRRASTVLATGSKKFQSRLTHPPYEERIKAIGTIDKFLPPDIQPAALHARICFEAIIDLLWKAMLPHFESMYAYGIRIEEDDAGPGSWLPRSY
ncbi:MAG: hypothetical protein WAS21_11575 [Geminicoccaceae bacterium]